MFASIIIIIIQHAIHTAIGINWSKLNYLCPSFPVCPEIFFEITYRNIDPHRCHLYSSCIDYTSNHSEDTANYQRSLKNCLGKSFLQRVNSYCIVSPTVQIGSAATGSNHTKLSFKSSNTNLEAIYSNLIFQSSHLILTFSLCLHSSVLR